MLLGELPDIIEDEAVHEAPLAWMTASRTTGSRRLSASTLNFAGRGFAASICAACILAGSITGCSTTPQNDVASIFRSDVDEVILEVDYQEGAAPFVGDFRNGTQVWGLTEDNANALFGASSAMLDIPTTLDDMEEIEVASEQAFGSADIVEIAEANRSPLNSDARRGIYVVFLDGFFERNGTPQRQVLGVSINGRGIIAMFKPVIESAAPAPLRAFVEQSVLIHEFGHAVGLVNSGLPLTSDHHDAENGAHCTNRQCVMYHQNEGISDIIEFAVRVRETGSNVLFGEECVDDALAASD